MRSPYQPQLIKIKQHLKVLNFLPVLKTHVLHLLRQTIKCLITARRYRFIWVANLDLQFALMTIGGMLRYRWGKADGTQRTIVQAAPNVQGDQAPRNFGGAQPFNQ